MAENKSLLDIVKAIEGVSLDYVRGIEEFQNALTLAFDGKGERIVYEQIPSGLEKFPGLLKFATFKDFSRFYADVITGKLLAMAQSGKVTMTLKKTLRSIIDECNQTGVSPFVVPYTENVVGIKTHNVLIGGLHTDATFTLPDGTCLRSRFKFGGDSKEFELEQLVLKGLGKLGKPVMHLESNESYGELAVYSTPFYEGSDLSYLIKRNQEGKFEVAEEERVNRARELITLTIDAMHSLEKSAKIPANTLDELFDWGQEIEKVHPNVIRRGLHSDGLYDGLFMVAEKATGQPLVNEEELNRLLEKYREIVLDPISNFQHVLCHGDTWLGNFFETKSKQVLIADPAVILAPFAFDLYTIIEPLGLSKENRNALLEFAAQTIQTICNGDLVCEPNIDYADTLKMEYGLVRIHRDLMQAGQFLSRRKNEPNLPDPSRFYSRAIATMEALDDEFPEEGFVELAKDIKKYISGTFGDALKFTKPKDDEVYDWSSLVGNEGAGVSSIMMDLMNGLKCPEADSRLRQKREPLADGEETETATGVEEQDALNMSALFAAIPALPTPVMDAVKDIRNAFQNGWVEDKGVYYQLSLSRLPDVVADSMPTAARLLRKNIKEVPKSIEGYTLSLRGDELHLIAAGADIPVGFRQKFNLKSRFEQNCQNYSAPLRGVWTDARDIAMIRQKLVEKYDKDVEIVSLRDKVLFYARPLFRKRCVDELLFDTAPLEHQLLKYFNEKLKQKDNKGKRHSLNFPGENCAVKDAGRTSIEIPAVLLEKDTLPANYQQGPFGMLRLYDSDRREVLPLERILESSGKKIEDIQEQSAQTTTSGLSVKSGLNCKNISVQVYDGKAHLVVDEPSAKRYGLKQYVQVKLADAPVGFDTEAPGYNSSIAKRKTHPVRNALVAGLIGLLGAIAVSKVYRKGQETQLEKDQQQVNSFIESTTETRNNYERLRKDLHGIISEGFEALRGMNTDSKAKKEFEQAVKDYHTDIIIQEE
ncbi:hypothetical protein HY486_03135 [Candidatus Woesearchaeota archaeon]|nr:hypothetical protein [Candidatus Woesearchaeota archaeon]